MSTQTCTAAFFAGDPFHPETFLLSHRCGNEAVALAVRQHLVRPLGPDDVGEAPVCGTHRNTLARFTDSYRVVRDGSRLFPLRFEALVREPVEERQAA